MKSKSLLMTSIGKEIILLQLSLEKTHLSFGCEKDIGNFLQDAIGVLFGVMIAMRQK